MTIGQESEEKEIELHDDDEELVTEMLRFVYTGDYNEDACDAVPTSIFNVRMVVLAEKYLVRHLAEAADLKFARDSRTSWRQPSFAGAIAEAYANAADLK